MRFLSLSRFLRCLSFSILGAGLFWIPVQAKNQPAAEIAADLNSLDHPALAAPPYGKSAEKAVVGITIPEPSTLGLVGLTLLLITSRHRARRFGRSSEFSGPRSF